MCPFIGRLDDISTDGLALIEEIRSCVWFETQIHCFSASYYAYVNCAKMM
jgi:transaldolase